jgi:hypothetical protein
LVGRREGKDDQLRIPKGIKLKLIFSGNRKKCADVIHLAQDRGQWQVPVNTTMEVCDWVTYYWFIKNIPVG